MKIISYVFINLISFIIAIIFPSTYALGASAAVSVTVGGDGGVYATLEGSFDTCEKCDENGENCVTINNGDIWFYLDGGLLCIRGGNLSTSCTVLLNRSGLHGTHIFTGVATDGCGGEDTNSYTLTLDNTPEVSVISPEGRVCSPFDIVGKATFKPSLSVYKGVIYAYIDDGSMGHKNCPTESCFYSYRELTGSLYDLPPGGPHKVKLIAWGGGAYAEDQRTFYREDCTPSCEDKDGDGHYAFSSACPEGDDCDDNDPDIYPGAGELCDGKDNNCSGEVDETCIGCGKNNIDFGSSANLASGNLYYTYTLFEIKNSIPQIDFTISYNSMDSYLGPLGRGWTHNYNTNIKEIQGDKLVLMKEDGKRVYFTKDESGKYLPDPGSQEYSIILKDSDGSYLLEEKSGIIKRYSPQGKLISIKDRNGNLILLEYEGEDLISIEEETGRQITLTYNLDHRIISVSDPSLNEFTFNYDQNGYLVSITDPLGNRWEFSYDSSGRMLTKKDPPGYTTTYTYDSEGRVETSIDPDGNIKSITYDQVNNTAKVTERDGGIWIYKYDPSLNVPLEVTRPDGNKILYTYDSYGNLISERDPQGNITTYTYDDRGNLISVTDPLGNTTSYTYNEYNQITSITYPDGSITRYTYDDKGNLIALIDSDGAVTRYEYDERGNLIKIINPLGHTTTFTYDEYNNLIAITDPSGAITRFTYDTSGNMISQEDPEGNITRFEYNRLNQLIKIIDPQGNETLYTYDAAGNRTSKRDANGNTTYYEYNHRGQLIKVIDPLGGVTLYNYGNLGCSSCGGGGDRLTSIIDANGNKTAYEYDGLGRLIREIDPLGNQVTYEYDPKGNLIKKRDANGNIIEYTYDASGRLIKKSYPDGSYEIFRYDTRGNIVYAENKNIAYEFTYDSKGRLKEVKDSSGLTIKYEYDVIGNRIEMITPEGKVINYTYDSNNRLRGIDLWMGRFNFEYDSLGRRVMLTYPNGLTTTYSYYKSGYLKEILTQDSGPKPITSFIYTYDPVGNRINKIEGDKRYEYTYDAIYKLIRAKLLKDKNEERGKEKAYRLEEYTYDLVGNRLTGPKNIDYYYYNQGNRLIMDRKHRYEYDRNSNLIKKIEIEDEGEEKVWTYRYDYENRLIEVIKEEEDELKIISFKYDPFGRRIEKRIEEIEDGESEVKIYRYVYDHEDIILEYMTKREDGKERREVTRYLHGPGIDEPLAVEQKGRVYYYHADGLGSITALTDKKGRVVQRHEYDSFGNLRHQGNKVKQPYTFTGREWDKEIGLYYYRARYYDPEVGKFVSKEITLRIVNLVSIYPIRIINQIIQFLPYFNTYVDGVKNFLVEPNQYEYVGNNPINFIDPHGTFKGKPGDILKFLRCFKGLIKCASNIDKLNKECKKECKEGKHGSNMYKCALDKCWRKFERCLKFAIPFG
jgi:RHS repeat-associated protein